MHQESYSAKSMDVPDAQLLIEDFSSLDLDLRLILTEFRHCIYTAVERSAKHYPDYLPSFFSLIESVNDIIRELISITSSSSNFPSGDPLSHHLRDTATSRQKRINQRTDQVIQLNSALSYVISQAFSGTIPILERECAVQSYSLLGIGSAFQALFRLSEFVQGVFSCYPIDAVIEAKYKNLPGVDIFPSPRDFRPSLWDEDEFRIDTHLEGANSPPFRAKLIFYSGRLGFKESEFSVTAALQVLFGSDSARWSLTTLTHELMHAHVRALLAVILKTNDEGALQESFPRYYADLVACHKREPKRWKLIQSLRSMILNYLVQKRSFDSVAAPHPGKKISMDLVLPNRDELKLWIKEDFRDINEIMVHVCDYHYFYNAHDSLYLGLLWESWATVPGVLSEIDHYVFRSLVAVATKQLGAVSERFHLAVNILAQNLAELLLRRPNNPVVQAALEFVRNAENQENLLLKFLPALYLAEVTLKFFISRKIHATLVDDRNIEPVGGEYIYRVETSEFPGFDIASPVGFLADRLRRALAGGVLSTDEEHVSAWVLLACASARPPNAVPRNGGG